MTQVKHLFDLADRVAIVTGGAGLLGRQHAEVLSEAGANVVIADRVGDAAASTATELEEKFKVPTLSVAVDVGDENSVRAMVKQILERFGRIDILINNAAMTVKGGSENMAGYFAPFEEYQESLWQEALTVGLTGAYLCSQQVGRVMVEQGSGVIINISSTYGLVGPNQRLYEGCTNPYDPSRPLNTPVSYSVVKSGVLGLTRYLATYWAGKNIRVNALTPGGAYDGHDEEFVRSYSAKTVLGRMAKVDEYRGAILFLASDASSYMTGSNLVVDGGWTAW